MLTVWLPVMSKTPYPTRALLPFAFEAVVKVLQRPQKGKLRFPVTFGNGEAPRRIFTTWGSFIASPPKIGDFMPRIRVGLWESLPH